MLDGADNGAGFADLAACQRAFDDWRSVYDEQRPHDALGLDVPASRYRVSPRAFPEVLPAAEYDEGVIVRRVGKDGRISLFGRVFRLGYGLSGGSVGLVPDGRDGVWRVYHGHQQVWLFDLADVDDRLDEKDGRRRL